MNRLHNVIRLSSVALVLVSGISMNAQSASGQVSGAVTKSGGQALANATIIISAPQLIAPRTLRTDANGRYRFPLLPPGDYTLTVSSEGYITAKNQTPLRVGVGEQKNLDFSLKATGVAEATVSVVATSGVADKSDPKTSVNFSGETLTAIPTVNRSFEGALDLAPGSAAGPGGFGTAVIRGGKQQTAVYTLNGNTIGEDVSGTSGNKSFVEDSIEDTSVIISGIHGRYGRSGGGSINVATKTGGNEFSGSIRKYLSRNDWNALRPGQVGNGSNLANDFADRSTDVFISGPIWKDKIWFAASTTLSPTTGFPIIIGSGETPEIWAFNVDPVADLGLAWAPGTATASYGVGSLSGFDQGKGIVVNPQTDSKFYQGKITYAITPDHVVSIERSYNTVTTRNAGFNGGVMVASKESYTYPSASANTVNGFSYKGTLSGSMFIEVNLAEQTYTHLNGPLNPQPHVRYYVDGMGQGTAWPYGTNVNATKVENNANQQGSINLKYIADWNGQHDLDFGYQYYESVHHTSGISGPNMERWYVYGATEDENLLNAARVTTPDVYNRRVGFLAANARDASGTLYLGAAYAGSGYGVAPTYRKYVGVDGAHNNRNEGFYVTDVWTPNKHWTLLGALRMEHVRDTDTTGEVILKFWSDLSPRVSVKYDVNGDSAHVWSFTAAKFTEDITAGTTSGFISSPANAYIDFGWNASPAGQVTWVSYDQLLNTRNYDLTRPIAQTTNSVIGLDGVRNPYIHEFTAGYRRTRTNTGSYVGFNLVYKQWYNDFYQGFFAFDRSTWQYVSLDPALPPAYTLKQRVGNSSEITRVYKAFEMDFQEVMTDRLTLGGTYTYSRLTGNDEGGDSYLYPYKTNAVNQTAVTWSTQYYNKRDAVLANGWNPAVFSPDGLLLADQTHKARVYITYKQPLGKSGHISYSLLGRYDSGVTWSARSGHKNAGGASEATQIWWAGSGLVPSPAAPSTAKQGGFCYYSSPRGAFRLPDSSRLDFRLDFLAPIGISKLMLTGNIQINNVTNHIVMDNYDNNFAATTAASPYERPAVRTKNPAVFGTGFTAPGVYEPTYFQRGRSVSLSLGLKF